MPGFLWGIIFTSLFGAALGAAAGAALALCVPVFVLMALLGGGIGFAIALAFRVASFLGNDKMKPEHWMLLVSLGDTFYLPFTSEADALEAISYIPSFVPRLLVDPRGKEVDSGGLNPVAIGELRKLAHPPSEGLEAAKWHVCTEEGGRDKVFFYAFDSEEAARAFLKSLWVCGILYDPAGEELVTTFPPNPFTFRNIRRVVASKKGSSEHTWSEESSMRLGELQDVCNLPITEIPKSSSSSVKRAVELLNTGELSSPEGLAVVYSESQGGFFLLFRSDKRTDAEAIRKRVAGGAQKRGASPSEGGVKRRRM